MFAFDVVEGFLPIVLIVYGWQVHGALIGWVVGVGYLLITVAMAILVDISILFTPDKFSNPSAAIRIIGWVLFFLLCFGIMLSGKETGWGL